MSDTHAGSRYGLCSPDARLTDDDRGEYAPTLTPGQHWLWDTYMTAFEAVLSLAGKSRIDVIHNGDICQGAKHPEGNLSTRMADHLSIAAANMAPWLADKRVKSLMLLTGTSAHDFGEGSAEIAVARTLGKQVRLCWHARIDVNGYVIDAAHHGPHPGIYEWTSGAVARRYLLNRVMKERYPRDLYLRSHYHEFIRETIYRPRRADIVITPSMQLPGAYVAQVTRQISEVYCGIVALEIIDGRLAEVYPFGDEIDLTEKVTL